MVRRFAALALLLLAACADPATRCFQAEARELKTVEALIAETRGRIDRGYGEGPRGNSALNLCLGSFGRNVGLSYCTSASGRGQAVPVDTAAEERKLAALEARRSAILQVIQQKSAACPAPRGGGLAG
ncbi:MAG: hypothetical protein CVT84_18200 [Alphaproteobacteria bacterium HGW-Alphaproteobacteria-6]|nr:MAG: hypothetical protein CVT84_18200 [Alphaproteobacteria bacterium HGW-Alphaproteobacteria-6]